MQINILAATAKDEASYSNFNKIVKAMNNELANCVINPSARVFNNQNCDSNSEPAVNAISNFFNSSPLTNPYDKNKKVIDTNLCNEGSVVISSSNISGSNLAVPRVRRSIASPISLPKAIEAPLATVASPSI